MLVEQHHLKVFADYHQFYLWDPDMDPQAPTDYTDEDVNRRIKVGPHVFVVQPERNMEVCVTIEVHDSEPPFDEAEWDHIAEGSLHLPTGQLEVHECTGGSLVRLGIPPGWYRARTFHGGFDTIGENWLDGDDHYLVVLWPHVEQEVRVLKQAPLR